MKLVTKRFGLIALLLVLATFACKSETANPKYSPNEFALLIAASNDGEVGPCG